ncbi:MAG: GGDEF domain-containing protein [Micromonosporaceae bacterium]|nr:GGDEF domain-containing protein [Micromonosporaceae bacterium]
MEDQDHRSVVAVVAGFDTYQNPMLAGMREVLEAHNLPLLAYADDTWGPSVAPALVCALNRSSTCGVITTPTMTAERDAELHGLISERDLPVVHIGQQVPGRPCVRADNLQGMTVLMGLLLDECEIRAPVLVQGLAHHPDHVAREQVFRAEMARRGMPVDEELVIQGRSDPDITKHELHVLLKCRRDMDAVITMDDISGMVVIETLAEVGLRVPQDVVVTGFDNYPMAAINWPGLTTVDQNLQEQGATAARLLLNNLTGDAPPEHVLTSCTLMPRGSTAIGRASHVATRQTVESVARMVRVHLATQGELLRMGRALMKCHSLEDICQALPNTLAALNVPRAFLVVYERAEAATNDHPVTPSTARLALDYRDGAAHPVTAEAFPACNVLPDDLISETRTGFLAFQPLAGTQGPLGYLLFEQSYSPASIAEGLEMDLSRTMEAVFSAEALMDYSATLERLVTQRTQELMAEVAVRRQVEQDLRKANAELHRSVVIDGLTGIANRTALDRHFEEHWQRHVDHQWELAVLMVDVDLFKLYNDRYGHLLGDGALKTVASCLRKSSRYPHDLACRFGGEEFVVVLPRSGVEEALTVARRFSSLLATAAVPHAASPIAPVVTASIGIAAIVPSTETSPEELIAAADNMLYLAKKEGRNRIVAGSVMEPAVT